MNEFLPTTPFDLYELHLFRLVVKHRSFTKAAALAGLTQSAVTRQVQGMESALGIGLLERTTRSVRTTPAGEFLFNESARLLGDVELSLQRMREEFVGAKKEIRVGVSRSIGLAYLPGFFHATLKRTPQVSCRVTHESSADIFSALEASELDLGVLCPPRRCPPTVRVTHRFTDSFTLIAPVEVAAAFVALKPGRSARDAWLGACRWLLLDEAGETGRQLRAWMAKQGWNFAPDMQLDNFDLIINLVALGLGVSFVPIRALALYPHKHNIQRVVLPQRFIRDLVVVVRRRKTMPSHLTQFIENILF